MPELPEVETVVRELRAAGLPGRRILRARTSWAGVVDRPAARAFRRRLRGARIESVTRRAKYIVFRLSTGDALLAHLRMTGRFSLDPARSPRDAHERAAFELDDGRELRFSDTRKFGRFHLTADPGGVLDALGPEPLDRAFTAGRLRALLAGRRAMLKPLLLNQAFLAGLGNIYADEALWDAGLGPRRHAHTLRAEESKRLYRAIRRVLRRGVRNMGTTLGRGLTAYRRVRGQSGANRSRLRVFRRTGLPCPRCGEPIRRIVVSQRSTHFCPRCQG
ncbi:MAG: bifunctional DNA-formamidopyrimidine glycosylase/DNA-(apurinic or apyrimidinic site) lyase [Lentisphaerae bacterium]|nr:bifunctional DNA-formamidopyrimidine glycosylase/DNA-(apurinic or apyrimidinic site) lyase [Lentisphaerota bacterium]